MIKFIANADPEYRFFDCFRSVVFCQGWQYPGYILNLYWFRIEFAKTWEAN